METDRGRMQKLKARRENRIFRSSEINYFNLEEKKNHRERNVTSESAHSFYPIFPPRLFYSRSRLLRRAGLYAIYFLLYHKAV